MRGIGLIALLGLTACDQHEVTSKALAEEVKARLGASPTLTRLEHGARRPLALKGAQIKVEITGDVAQVEILQRFINPPGPTTEAIYAFQRPVNAIVDDFEIRAKDRRIHAEIKTLQEGYLFEVATQQARLRAREALEIRRKVMRAGSRAGEGPNVLGAAMDRAITRIDRALEEDRAMKARAQARVLAQAQAPLDVFTQRIDDLAAGSEIKARISYTQRLTYDMGVYELAVPMSAGSSDVSLSVAVNAGMPITDLTTPGHEVSTRREGPRLYLKLKQAAARPNRGFVMRYRLEGEGIRATLMTHKPDNGWGYLGLLIEPPRVHASTEPRELILIMDGSHSQRVKWGAMELLRRVRPSDTFNIYVFGKDWVKDRRLFRYPRTLDDIQLKRAQNFIKKSVNRGISVKYHDALINTFRLPVGAKKRRYIFFFSNGYTARKSEILSSAKLLNKLDPRGYVFGFAVGVTPHREFFHKLNRIGGGFSVNVRSYQESIHAITQFFTFIEPPVLKNLEIDWGGLKVEDLTPTPLPSLSASRSLMIRGRYAWPSEATIVIKGDLNGRPYRSSMRVRLPKLQAENSALASLWARSQVIGLEQRARTEGSERAKDQLELLGVKHQVETAYSKLSVVDSAIDLDSMKIINELKRVYLGRITLDLIKNSQTFFERCFFQSNCDFYFDKTMLYMSQFYYLVFTMLDVRKIIANKNQNPGAESLLCYVVNRICRAQGQSLVKKQNIIRQIRLKNVTHRPSFVLNNTSIFDFKPNQSILRAKVILGKIKVKGKIGRETVRRIFRRHRNEYRYCYEKELHIKRKLSGDVTVKFTLDQHGQVIAGQVHKSSLNDANVERCLIKKTKRWIFPKPKRGIVTIYQTLIFRPR